MPKPPRIYKLITFLHTENPTHKRLHEAQAGGNNQGSNSIQYPCSPAQYDRQLCEIRMASPLLCSTWMILGIALLPSFGVLSGNMCVPVSWQFALGVFPVLLC